MFPGIFAFVSIASIAIINFVSAGLIHNNFNPKHSSDLKTIFSKRDNETIPDIPSSTKTKKYAKKETRDFLDRIYLRLISCLIDEDDFIGVKFDIMTQELAADISEMRTWTQVQFPRNKEFSDKVNFANHTFSVMEEASGYLKFYRVRGTDQFLVRRILQLNVKLLRFFDSRGNPDPSVPGYIDHISTFARIMESWIVLYQDLTDLPLGVAHIFEDEFRKASDTINQLVNFFPINRIYVGKNLLTAFRE